jgi:glycosyltransferase involved in cell wall biosynthesis
MQNMTDLKDGVTAIVPAYNEAETILEVVRRLEFHPLIDEVIVVSDGSTDATAQRARESGAIVIELQNNVGKGEAMAAGVARSSYNTLLFADADLVGLSNAMITLLLSKVLSDEHVMYTLVRDRVSEHFQLHLPSQYVVGGERALRRELWDLVPAEDRQGFGVELALNYYAQKQGMRTGHTLAEGLSQVIKEKKHGLVRGFLMRLLMTAQCVKALFKLHILGRARVAAV